jgi:hypothetical protein
MEPAHGRRLSRLAVTLWVAVPAPLAVALWADPDWARVFYSFVLLTAAALALVASGSDADEE